MNHYMKVCIKISFIDGVDDGQIDQNARVVCILTLTPSKFIRNWLNIFVIFKVKKIQQQQRQTCVMMMDIAFILKM